MHHAHEHHPPRTIQDRDGGHPKQRQIARGSPTEQPPASADDSGPSGARHRARAFPAFETGSRPRANYAGSAVLPSERSAPRRSKLGALGAAHPRSAVAACPRAIRRERGAFGEARASQPELPEDLD
ncbi:hypothetical protein MTO96_015450 [Rhipicephalus appendiculatus]